MKRTLPSLLVAATLLLGASSAHAMVEVIKPTDAQLDCPNLTKELGTVEQTLGEKESLAGNAAMTQAGIGLATQAAVSSGLAGSLGSSLPLFGSVVSAANSLAQQQKQASEEERRQLQMRRYYLFGLYQGRQCSAQNTTSQR